MSGDSDWLAGHDLLRQLHLEKSGGYGTAMDALANFVAVSKQNGQPPFLYAVDRATEKQARIRSLAAQGRLDELEEEFLDVASGMLCGYALVLREIRSRDRGR